MSPVGHSAPRPRVVAFMGSGAPRPMVSGLVVAAAAPRRFELTVLTRRKTRREVVGRPSQGPLLVEEIARPIDKRPATPRPLIPVAFLRLRRPPIVVRQGPVVGAEGQPRPVVTDRLTAPPPPLHIARAVRHALEISGLVVRELRWVASPTA